MAILLAALALMAATAALVLFALHEKDAALIAWPAAFGFQSTHALVLSLRT